MVGKGDMQTDAENVSAGLGLFLASSHLPMRKGGSQKNLLKVTQNRREISRPLLIKLLEF